MFMKPSGEINPVLYDFFLAANGFAFRKDFYVGHDSVGAMGIELMSPMSLTCHPK